LEIVRFIKILPPLVAIIALQLYLYFDIVFLGAILSNYFSWNGKTNLTLFRSESESAGGLKNEKLDPSDIRVWNITVSSYHR
jgi:hypothetical protein